jgi:hypothetical protein
MKKILLLVLIFSLSFVFFSCADATKEVGVQQLTFPAPASVTADLINGYWRVVFPAVSDAVDYNLFVRYEEPYMLTNQFINTGDIKMFSIGDNNPVGYSLSRSEVDSLFPSHSPIKRRFGVSAVSINNIKSSITWASTTITDY